MSYSGHIALPGMAGPDDATFIGTDPEHPEELGAEVLFSIEDEFFSITKSCLIYVPRGIRHAPIPVPGLDRPVCVFSGGNGREYKAGGIGKN